MFLYSNFPEWIGPTVVPFLPIRWYAVMYLVAFTVTFLLFRYQCVKEKAIKNMSSDDMLNLFIYLILGLVLGARLFSTLLYDGSSYYWTHPWMIFWPFRHGTFVGLPGMSYHGGAIGAAVGCAVYCRRYKRKFYEISDAILAGTPLGYTFGRLGNFINGELWGRCTASGRGMIFPDAGRFSTNYEWVRDVCDKAGIEYQIGDYVNLPRFPSQLYEGLFEGIVLFLLIWFVIKPCIKKNYLKVGRGFVTGFYFAGYGFFRFFIEYLREPDEQLGFIISLGKESEPIALFKSFFNFSMGQILCFGMIVVGAIIMYKSKRRYKVANSKN